MKKYLSILLSVLLLLTAVPLGIISVSAASEFAGGSGTESAPYLVSTKAQLDNVRNYLSAHFRLTADIVFTEADFELDGPYYNDSDGWEPIGPTFAGVFDGGNHTIYNLKVDTVGDYAGLFGKVSGTVRNLRLSDADIQADQYVGGLCGSNSGTIQNVHVTDSKVLGTYRVGGICGDSKGTISACYVDGAVTSTGDEAGGIVGYAEKSITQCYNAATVTAAEKNAGGIVGHLTGKTVSSCVNEGTITGSHAGAIVGYTTFGPSYITNCFNKGQGYRNIHGGAINDKYCSIFGCYNINGGISAYGASVTGCYTAADDLTNKRTFIDWDFDTVWTMAGDANYPYPELRCFTLQGVATIEGAVAVGETVSASFDSSANQPDSLTYEWYVDNVLVDSGATYTITAAAEGKELKVRAVSGDVLCAGHVASAVYTVASAVDLDEPTIVVSTLEANVGDEIQVEVKLLNNPGVIAATVEIEYDKNIMELVTYYDEDEEVDRNMIEVASGWSSKYITFGPVGKCIVSFIRSTAVSNVTKEDFFTATFKIKEDAPCGTYPLTVKCDPANFFALDFEEVSFGKQDGSVTIHEYVGVETQAPTCTAAGEMTYTCSKCEDSYTEEIAVIAHNYGEATETLAPTCTTDGKKTYTCSACGDVKSETIKAGHTYVDGFCSVCGEKTTEPTIVVSILEATAGDEIEVQVKLLNNPGVIAATVEILYDHDALELPAYFDEDEEMWMPQIEVGSKFNASSNKYITFGPIDEEAGVAKECVVSYIRGTATSNVTKEDFFTATFKIKEDVPCGTYPLTVKYDPANFFAMGFADVNFGKQDGSVTITCAHANWDPCTGICFGCGKAVKPAHGTIIAVDAKDATCTEDGNIAYWYCESCGQTWLDEARTLNTNPEAVILPALGHVSAVHIAARSSTCTVNGNVEYWYCADCDKAWLDEDYTLPINLKAVFLPLEDHTYDDKYDADCNVCGNIREVPVRPIFGDASGDGIVNGRDLALLQQYMADWEVIIDKAAADINDNGAINARDVALLQQYIAGWDVKFG